MRKILFGVASLLVWLGFPTDLVADQVILDDLIVDGSLAVGQDSVNGESFGFDTIRLKENNLRVHFDDTSASGSFPGNDWRIVINDSSNGGANYFAIEDSTAGRQIFRVNAGAPVDSLVVHNTGRIGIGIPTPVVQLHVRDGNSPTLRLEQDGSSGFNAQSWDVAGNEANFFVRDVTNGSKLPFKIRPNTETDTLVLDPDGIEVRGTAFISETLEIGSSRTRKKNIREVSLEEAQDALENLEPVRFRYLNDDEEQLGFIAEDVPDLVATGGRKSVVPMDFVAVLTKVVQSHERREQELENTVQSQRDLLNALSKRLADLESLVGRGGDGLGSRTNEAPIR